MSYFDHDVELFLTDFLWEITNSLEYDYVILMSRKMYSLYRSFEITMQSKPVIMASNAIPFRKEEFRNARVLIVDDIRIHGRTASWISKELSDKEYAPQCVDYKVFIIEDNSIPSLDDGIEENSRFTYHLGLPRNMWRKISRQIIERIMGTLTPLRYSSCYAHVSSQLVEEEIVRRLGLDRIENYDPEYDEVRSYIWKPDCLSNQKTEEGLLRYCIIRIDFSNYMKDRVLVLPQVFLNALSSEDAQRLFASISDKEWDPSDLCHYFEYLASQWCMQTIMPELQDKLGIDNSSVILNDSDLDYCFNRELVSYARDESFFERFEQILMTPIRKYRLSSNEGNIMEMIAKEEILKGAMGYFRYLCEAGFADEILFTLKESKRIEGARIQYLLNKVNVKMKDIVYALAKSITTYNYRTVNGWTTLRIIPGESAFSYVLFSNGEIIDEIQYQTITRKPINEREKKEIILAFDKSFKMDGENINSDLFVILESLSNYLKMRNSNSKLKNDIDTQFMYIQYMTDIGVSRKYSTVFEEL